MSEEEKNEQLIATISNWIAIDKRKEEIYKIYAIFFAYISLYFKNIFYLSLIFMIITLILVFLLFKIKKDIDFHYLMLECEL